MANVPPAGWYPDPEDNAQFRYWDGGRWTEHRAPRTGPAAQAGPAPVPGPGVGRTEPVPREPPDEEAAEAGASVPARSQRSGVRGWLLRHPWATLAVGSGIALLVGIAIGLSGSDPELEDARTELEQTSAQLDRTRSENRRLESRLTAAEDRIEKLSARGEVPDFTGQTLAEAETNEQVTLYEWKIKPRRQISDEADPGTVIGQTPNEGKVLAAGRSITLAVARKPPPKPKQWVTIRTLTGSGGASKSDQFTIPRGSVRIVYNMPGEGNNAITLYRAPREYVDLLVNDIGPTSGKTRVYDPGRYYLDVMGDSWTVEIQIFKRPT